MSAGARYATNGRSARDAALRPPALIYYRPPNQTLTITLISYLAISLALLLVFMALVY